MPHTKAGISSSRAKRIDAQYNYEHLLDVARTVVATEGTNASLRDIARRAGVGLGTLYRHFPTRDALLEAILRNRFDELGKKAEKLEESDAPLAALMTWLEEFTAGSAGYRGLTSSMMATMKDPESALYVSCLRMREAGGRLLKRAQRVGDIRVDVTSADLFALTSAITWVAGFSPSGVQSRTRLLSLIMNGLESRVETASARTVTKNTRSKGARTK